MSGKPHIHVTTGRCELKHCGWTGFHFHWRHRRFRSAFDGSMTQAEQEQFDNDCLLTAAVEPSGEAR